MPTIDNKSEIDKIYAQVSPKADELYYFVNLYHEYMNQPRDYDCSGEKLSMAEIHLLTLISDQKGITASQLVKQWGTTKGAISQNIKKLEDKGLIYRQKENGNAKVVHIYPTKKGEHLSTAHKSYDTADIIQTRQDLLKSCTSDEIDTFYKVLHEYIKLF